MVLLFITWLYSSWTELDACSSPFCITQLHSKHRLKDTFFPPWSFQNLVKINVFTLTSVLIVVIIWVFSNIIRSLLFSSCMIKYCKQLLLVWGVRSSPFFWRAISNIFSFTFFSVVLFLMPFFFLLVFHFIFFSTLNFSLYIWLFFLIKFSNF